MISKHPYLVTRVRELPGTVVFQAVRIDPEAPGDLDTEAAVHAYTPIEAIAIARQEAIPPAPEARLYTAEEMAATVKAVVNAERRQGRDVMGHIRADRDVGKESAEAIRQIVVAAYIDLLVGK